MIGQLREAVFFFFNDTATTEIYTLSLHDALPILWLVCGALAKAAMVTASMAAMSSGVTCRSWIDRKSTRLNSSHSQISYAVFCLKKKKNKEIRHPNQLSHVSVTLVTYTSVSTASI